MQQLKTELFVRGIRAAKYADADARRRIRQQIRLLTADAILLQASVYIADAIEMTATFLVVFVYDCFPQLATVWWLKIKYFRKITWSYDCEYSDPVQDNSSSPVPRRH